MQTLGFIVISSFICG